MKDEGRTLRVVERLADRISALERSLKNGAEKLSQQAYSPRNYCQEKLKDNKNNKELSSPAVDCLKAITQLVGKNHWRYLTQEGICKNTEYRIRSVKYGLKELEEKGIIVTRCRYKSGKHQKPIRTSSAVWLIELSRLALSASQPEDFKIKSMSEIYAALSAKPNPEFIQKLPPEPLFLRPKKKPRQAKILRSVKCKKQAP